MGCLLGHLLCFPPIFRWLQELQFLNIRMSRHLPIGWVWGEHLCVQVSLGWVIRPHDSSQALCPPSPMWRTTYTWPCCSKPYHFLFILWSIVLHGKVLGIAEVWNIFFLHCDILVVPLSVFNRLLPAPPPPPITAGGTKQGFHFSFVIA